MDGVPKKYTLIKNKKEEVFHRQNQKEDERWNERRSKRYKGGQNFGSGQQGPHLDLGKGPEGVNGDAGGRGHLKGDGV